MNGNEKHALEKLVQQGRITPKFSMQVQDYLDERYEFAETIPGPKIKKELIETRHALLGEYQIHEKHTRGEYTGCIARVVVKALAQLREKDPRKYNIIAATVLELIQATGDKLILPTYSKKRDIVTRNSATKNGGIYDLTIILPNGEPLSIIAKKYANTVDFENDVLSENAVGTGLLAVDETRKIKYEMNKGDTDLTEKLADMDKYQRVAQLAECARKVISDLKASDASEQFHLERDGIQRTWDRFADAVTGSHNKGIRYRVPEVTNFTEDFLQRFVYRLSTHTKAVIASSESRRKGYNKFPSLKKLRKILKSEFEPVFKRQRTQVINADLNPGNFIFDDQGNVHQIDRELTRVDHVQKCAYDITEKSQIPLEQELRIADMFHSNLDTGVDHKTFREIYLKRRIIEDLCFTRNLEYAEDEIKADSPVKAQAYENLALYYFNRALRTAKEQGISPEFTSAVLGTMAEAKRVSQSGEEYTLDKKLFLLTDEGFDKLKEEIPGYMDVNLTQDPLADLQMTFATEFSGRDNLGFRQYRQSPEGNAKRRIIWALAIGLGMSAFCGGVRQCDKLGTERLEQRMPWTDAEYIKMSNKALNSKQMDKQAVELIEKIGKRNVPDHWTQNSATLKFDFAYKKWFETLIRNHTEFGMSRKVLSAIMHTSALYTVNKVDDSSSEYAVVGEFRVPRSHIEDHILFSVRPSSGGMYRQKKRFVEFTEDSGNFYAASSYLKLCELRNQGDVVNVLAEYFMKGKTTRSVMVKAGSENYFDTKDKTTGNQRPGYRHQLSAEERKLIDTALYFYLHIQVTGRHFDRKVIY